MSLLAFLIVGFLMGLIARVVAPKHERMTVLTTTALGIGGALVGGVVSSWLSSGGDLRGLHATPVVYSVLGALLVLVFTNLMGSRTHRRA